LELAALQMLGERLDVDGHRGGVESCHLDERGDVD
jgi:hypothetical protein